MTPADLVAMAARLLGLDTARALDLVDLDAAETALAEAAQAPPPVERQAAALLVALVRHRPFSRANHQVALLATLQFLGERGLDLDLGPHAARDLIKAIESGTTGSDVAARLRVTERPAMHMTERAHHAVRAARAAATAMQHNYVGTEHLLLGVLDAGGVGGEALAHLDLDPQEVRDAIERIVGFGTSTRDPHLTPRSKKVLHLARREAKRMRRDQVDTEHILLAIVREGDGLAAQILHERRGLDRATIVQTVQDLLTPAPRREALLAELNQLFDENERLHQEVERLKDLLRRHGIDGTRSA